MSLKNCIAKAGLSKFEGEILMGDYDRRVAAGATNAVAAMSAIDDAIAEALDERADLVQQIEKQLPKFSVDAMHGSPYDFDEFSAEFMGSGEGNQAFGHGLYFSELVDVAKYYREGLSHRGGAHLSLAGVVPSARDKGLSDSAWIAAKDLSHLLVPNAGVTKTFGELDVKSRGMVLARMIDVLKDDKVLRAVVGLVPVDMMNMLTPKKFSAKALLNKPSVLVDLLSEYANNPVASGVQAVNVLAPAVAVSAAKVHTGLARFDVVASDLVTAEGTIRHGAGSNVASKIPHPSEFSKGRLYKVTLAPDEDAFLDWDLPLREQSEKVKNAIRPALDMLNKEFGHPREQMMSWSGQQLYEEIALAQGVGKTMAGSGVPVADRDKAASKYLSSIGIPGNKYRDQFSRRMVSKPGPGEKPTFNFVVFDDKLITIKEKFSAIGPEAPAGGISKEAAEKMLAKATKHAKDMHGMTVKVVSDAEARKIVKVPDGKRAKGFILGNTIYLVHDNLADKQDIEVNLAHELVGHFGIENVVKNWPEVVKLVKELMANPKGEFKDLLDEVTRRYGSMGLSETDFIKELIAVATERKVKAGPIGEIIRKIRAAVRAFLKMFGIDTLYGPTEIDNMISAAARFVETGRSPYERTDMVPQFSVAPDDFNEKDYRPAVVSWAKEKWGEQKAPDGSTIWKNFVYWFGDSKAVDAEGKPLVVYHGTASVFQIFKQNDSGISGYFTPDPRFASEFADSTADGIASVPPESAAEANVMPVFLSIKNPWDYENPAHVKMLAKETHWTAKRTVKEETAALSTGFYMDLEDSAITEAMQRLGFDGFYVNEGENRDEGIKNIAAFRPEQIKSAIGNRGTFDPTNPDIRFSVEDDSARHGRLTESRIDRLLRQEGVSHSPERTRAWLAWINPQDFVDATTPESEREGLYIDTDALDVRALSEETQTPFLMAGENRVRGHEGRHRMVALRRERVKRVPVVVINYDRSAEEFQALKPQESMVLGAQRYSGSRPTNTITLHNLQPISYGNRDTLIKEFGTRGRSDDVMFAVENNEYAEANRLIRGKDKNAWEAAKKLLAYGFAPGGLLPEQAWRQNQQRMANLNASDWDVAHMLGVLDRAARKAYGRTLANTVRGFAGLSKEVRERLGAILGDLPQGADGTVGTRPADVPQEVWNVIVGMRKQIDGYSWLVARDLQNQIDELMPLLAQGSDEHKAEAKAKVKLLRTIMGNIGKYVHRSYRAYTGTGTMFEQASGSWRKNVSDKAIGNARAYLVERFMDVDEESGEAAMDEAEATTRANALIEKMLANSERDGSFHVFVKTHPLGAKELSVLMKRGDLAEPLRELLGEHKSLDVLYASTMTKMSRLVWNQAFLRGIKESGMGVWLFEKEQPGYTAKIAVEGNPAMEPLNGLYTSKEIAKEFNYYLGTANFGAFMKSWLAINGFAKWQSTIGSPLPTGARNWMSGFLMAMANGDFDFRNMAASVIGLREYFWHSGEAAQIYYHRNLVALGVSLDNPFAGELQQLLRDTNLENFIAGKWVEIPFKAAVNLANKFYQYGDDFWKINGFENKKSMLLRHDNADLVKEIKALNVKYKVGIPKMFNFVTAGDIRKAGGSEALITRWSKAVRAAEVEAAQRVRDTYMTYSMVGKVMKALRINPLVGVFVSFASESIRTQVNVVRYIAKDVKAGRKEMAARALVGMALAHSWVFAAMWASMAGNDIDDDDEEMVRISSPWWQENSTFWFMPRKPDGTLRYMDTTYLDPYNIWHRPIAALMRDGPWEEKLTSVARDFLMSFFGPEIGTRAIAELVMNKETNTGKEIVADGDDLDEIAKKWAAHLAKGMQGSMIRQVRNLAKAIDGEVSKTRKYDPIDETAALFGFRIQSADPKITLLYKGYDFQTKLRSAAMGVYDVLRNPNEVDKDDLYTAYDRLLRIRGEAFADMGTVVKAVENQGLGEKEVSRLLDKVLAHKDVRGIINGKPSEWYPSKASETNASDVVEELVGEEYADRIRSRYREFRDELRQRNKAQ